MLSGLRKNADLIALLIWCGGIFFLSSVPSLSSGLEEDFLLRKIAHALEFAVLTCLFFNVLRKRSSQKIFNISMSALAALAYAFTDEVHQTFVRGRSGNFFDIGIDSVGIIFGVAIVMVFSSYYRYRPRS